MWQSVSYSRNKAVDLSQPEGEETVKRLIHRLCQVGKQMNRGYEIVAILISYMICST